MSDFRDDGRVVYHSRRPDQSPSGQAEPQAKPPFRRRNGRNRSLIIILLDVALILLIYAVVSSFVATDSWRGTIAGVEAELHVVPGDAESLWQLRLTRRRPAEELAPNRIVSALFLDGTEPVSEPLLDVLPERVGDLRVVDCWVPHGARIARVLITVDGEQLTLERRPGERSR